MSSSTGTGGKCVVCGTETEKRCSECAKFGTDWMFFCSKEHQKLVWYLHKRVCGKRSNPFTWPGLTDKEIEDFMELARKPYMSGDGRIETWMEAHRKLWPLRELRPELDDETNFYNDLETCRESAVADTEAANLIYFRLFAFSKAAAVMRYTGNGDLLTVIKSIPLGYILNLQVPVSRSKNCDLPGDPTSIPSWSAFQHRFLIYAAVSLDSIPVPKHTEEFVKYTEGAIRELCEKEVGSKDPELAEAIAISLEINEV